MGNQKREAPPKNGRQSIAGEGAERRQMEAHDAGTLQNEREREKYSRRIRSSQGARWRGR
jgi:hypothetical protein